MNDQIQELKTQALEWFARERGLELVHLSPTLDPLSQKQVDEKFAKLIIEKCGDIADDYAEHGLPSVDIDSYFGIHS